MASAKFRHRKLAAAVAVLLALNMAAWYQLAVRSQRPPNFDRGGRFAVAGATAKAESATTATVTNDPAVTPVLSPSTTIAAPANAYAPSSVTATSTGIAVTPGVLPPPV